MRPIAVAVAYGTVSPSSRRQRRGWIAGHSARTGAPVASSPATTSTSATGICAPSRTASPAPAATAATQGEHGQDLAKQLEAGDAGELQLGLERHPQRHREDGQQQPGAGERRALDHHRRVAGEHRERQRQHDAAQRQRQPDALQLGQQPLVLAPRQDRQLADPDVRRARLGDAADDGHEREDAGVAAVVGHPEIAQQHRRGDDAQRRAGRVRDQADPRPAHRPLGDGGRSEDVRLGVGPAVHATHLRFPHG